MIGIRPQFSLPFGRGITARAKRIVAAIVLAAILQGCVAAALPVLAGGAIVGTEATRNKSKASDDATVEASVAEAALAETEKAGRTKTLPAAKTQEPDNPPESALSMAELALRDIETAQTVSSEELPPANSETTTEAGQNTESAAVSNRQTAGRVEVDPARFAQMSVYVLKALAKDAPPEGRLSAILTEPSSLKPIRLPCGRSKLAVLVDLDPKGGLHAPGTIAATYDGDVLGHLSRLRDAGVKIGWISALTAADAGAVRKALRVSGLDVKGEDELVLLRYPGDRKQTRRAEFGAAHCLIALAGDERADFDELYDYLLRPSSAVTLEPMIGQGWFLLPALQ